MENRKPGIENRNKNEMSKKIQNLPLNQTVSFRFHKSASLQVNYFESHPLT